MAKCRKVDGKDRAVSEVRAHIACGVEIRVLGGLLTVLISTGRLVVATAFEPKKLWDDRCHSNDVYDCQLLMVLPMVSLLSETDSLFLKGYDLHVSTPSRSFGLQSSLAERITLIPTILRLRFLSYEMNLTVCI